MFHRLILLFTLVPVIAAVAPAYVTPGEAWDREGASKAWAHAQELKRDILGKSSAPLPEYLECIKYFQLVYRLDPHFGQSDDSVFEAAALYQHIGKMFGEVEHLKRAAQLYKFLSVDYPTSKWAPEALLLLGDLNAGPLDSPSAAEAAYARLTASYRASKAASRYIDRDRGPNPGAPVHTSVSTPQPGRPEPRRTGGGPLPAPSAQPVTLNKVEHLTQEGHTKVTIETSGQTAYRIQRLKEPERVFFDLENAILPRHLLNSSTLVQDPRLKQLRLGQNQPSTARVVLDLEARTDYSVTELRDPFRIVIRVTTLADEAAVAARGGLPQGKTAEPKPPSVPVPVEPIVAGQAGTKPVTVPAHAPLASHSGGVNHPTVESPSLARGLPPRAANTAADIVRSARADSEMPGRDAKPVSRTPEPVPLPKMSTPTSLGNRTVTRSLGLKVARIVIDPGHGGHDLGTVGPGGLVEKDFVLRLALDLRALLVERLGAEVILTRVDDSFVPLEDRTAMANADQADLFVSLHANYSPSKSTSGVETYFLDFARTKEEREVAARENAATLRTVGDLQSLVGRIARGEKMEESRELASVIQTSLFGTARQLMRTSKNRGVRSAPFIVLIGAEMPSILVEVAFLSNPADEKALKLDSNRQKVAAALLGGIATYMKTLGSETAQFSIAPIR